MKDAEAGAEKAGMPKRPVGRPRGKRTNRTETDAGIERYSEFMIGFREECAARDVAFRGAVVEAVRAWRVGKGWNTKGVDDGERAAG